MPIPCLKNSSKKFTKSSVRRWMRDNAADYIEGDEVNATALAEAAANEFDQADADGPLDDESHWIWEVAAKVASEVAV